MNTDNPKGHTMSTNKNPTDRDVMQQALTDAQCDEFRRMPVPFNDMVRAIYAAGAALAAPQPALSKELAEADRRAGAAERELALCRDDLARLDRVRDQMKRQWGVDRNVSFDAVWAEALKLKHQAAAQPAQTAESEGDVQLRACDQSTGREYFIKSGPRAAMQAEADKMNEAGHDYFVLPKLAPQPAQDQGLIATLAGLEASTGHLSAIVDQQRALLAEVEDVFGRDERGIPFEDGDSMLIDKVRAHLACIATPQAPQPAQEPAAPYTGDVVRIMREAGMTFHLGLPHKAVVEQMTRVVDLVYAEASIKAAVAFAAPQRQPLTLVGYVPGSAVEQTPLEGYLPVYEAANGITSKGPAA